MQIGFMLHVVAIGQATPTLTGDKANLLDMLKRSIIRYLPTLLLLASSLNGVVPSAKGQTKHRTYFQDPAVPMISLPTQFTSYRSNSDRRIPEAGQIDIARLKGPGCVRHIWLLPGDHTILEVRVDDAPEPQIHVPLKPFFGIMHGLSPYPINCAAYSVFPNPLPGLPGTPGYNLYLPIPFAKSCRITLRGPKGERAVAMTDWHRYDNDYFLTPFRLHASHRLEKPSDPRGSYFEIADIKGSGFLAGVVIGYIQKNHSDMVFHTGGMTMLLDGETNPHVIRGHNVEDDFGFTWGFNDQQTRWAGCPWHVNRGRLDQDGVFYRFFGPDPVAFNSSLLFRTGSRGDDVESVAYYYLDVSASNTTRMVSPEAWEVVGLWPLNVKEDWERLVPLPKNTWPETVFEGDRPHKVHRLKSQRGWIDLQHVYFEKHHGATPLTMLNHAAYARTFIESSRVQKLQLKLSLDDTAVVWWNGKKAATLYHQEDFKTGLIEVKSIKGRNTLLIKTINTDAPMNKRMWAIHVAVELEKNPSTFSGKEKKPGQGAIKKPKANK